MAQIPPASPTPWSAPSEPPAAAQPESRKTRHRPAFEQVLVVILCLLFFIPGIVIYGLWKSGRLSTKAAVIAAVVLMVLVYTLVLAALFSDNSSGESNTAQEVDDYIARVLPTLKGVSGTGTQIDTALAAAANDSSSSATSVANVVRVCDSAHIAYARDLRRLHLSPPASVAAINTQFIASITDSITACGGLQEALTHSNQTAAAKALQLWLSAREEFRSANTNLNLKAKTVNAN